MADELERARKAVRELSKTLKSLPIDPPPEEVHRLRTTTRRVEAIVSVLAQVEGKESRRVLKSIEPIRKAAGGVREVDVMFVNARKLARYVAGDSLTRLLEHLQIARQQNAEVLRRVLGRRRNAARENLKQYSRYIQTALAPEKESCISQMDCPPTRMKGSTPQRSKWSASLANGRRSAQRTSTPSG
jgi:CHAD domain-containing protein